MSFSRLSDWADIERVFASVLLWELQPHVLYILGVYFVPIPYLAWFEAFESKNRLYPFIGAIWEDRG
jgi:hypothetical protein